MSGVRAALPMQDSDFASRELTRCISELGFKGALVNGFSQVDDADSAFYYDLPQYWSFWESSSNWTSLAIYIRAIRCQVWRKFTRDTPGFWGLRGRSARRLLCMLFGLWVRDSSTNTRV
jgi:predicted TIM-barrel fold metal-dependent hydrolase